MNKIFQYLLILITCLTFSSNCHADQNTKTLKAAATRYIEFLQSLGKADAKDTETQISELFAPECKKVMNGKTGVPSREDLGPHFSQIKKKMGTWTINNKDTIVSPEDQACVVRYTLKTSKDKAFITIAILRFDPKGQITEINEVYNKFKE